MPVPFQIHFILGRALMNSFASCLEGWKPPGELWPHSSLG